MPLTNFSLPYLCAYPKSQGIFYFCFAARDLDNMVEGCELINHHFVHYHWFLSLSILYL
jgi:hypothetical protein